LAYRQLCDFEFRALDYRNRFRFTVLGSRLKNRS
jgi:hypothetical protein